jgi:hypothetical protein
VRKTLLSPMLLWLIVVKQSQPTTSALIESKATWCVAVQVGKSMSADLCVNGVSTSREWQGFSYPSRVEGKGTWGSGWGSSCLDPHTPVPLNRG